MYESENVCGNDGLVNFIMKHISQKYTFFLRNYYEIIRKYILIVTWIRTETLY